MSPLVWIVPGIVGLFVVMMVVSRVLMTLQARAMVGKSAPEDLSGDPGRAVRKGRKALFYFYSSHCPPCRAMTPVIDELAAECRDVYKVDVGQDMLTARKFGVMATPSVILVEGGRIQAFLVGPQSRSRLVRLIRSGDGEE